VILADGLCELLPEQVDILCTILLDSRTLLGLLLVSDITSSGYNFKWIQTGYRSSESLGFSIGANLAIVTFNYISYPSKFPEAPWVVLVMNNNHFSRHR